ncbi:MAG: IS5 family transposase, partial [Natronospirillum sp.]
MKPYQPEHSPQKNFLEPELRDIINPRHELVVLSQRIDWTTCEAHFGELYHQSDGRPGLPIRLLVGLHFIKHLYKLSDEQCVARWVENPYYQYFCGEQYFQHRMPLDPTSMTRFRQRLGEAGVNELLKLTIQAGLDTGTIQPESLKLVVADTTVMEKSVAYPTDLRLLLKARQYLVAQAKAHGIQLRQTYAKEFRALAHKASGYAHARQMNRLRNVLRKMSHRIGRLMRELMRKVPADEAQAGLLSVIERAGQAVKQSMDPKTSDKLYAFHAPEVACIRKGKARNPNEFGCKVSVVTTAEEYFVLACHALPGNPYDGHTLNSSLIKTTANTGVLPGSVLVDRGYKSAERRNDVIAVHITGRKTGKGK